MTETALLSEEYLERLNEIKKKGTTSGSEFEKKFGVKFEIFVYKRTLIVKTRPHVLAYFLKGGRVTKYSF